VGYATDEINLRASASVSSKKLGTIEAVNRFISMLQTVIFTLQFTATPSVMYPRTTFPRRRALW
jgi:hypothetical protein